MPLSFDTDGGSASRAALGLIVLQADQTIEHEFSSLLGLDGVGLYQSRIASDFEVTPEALAGMEAALPEAVRLLPPSIDFDVIGYACTTGAMVLGEATVARIVAEGRPGVPASNPLTALKAASAALGLGSVGLLSPYVEAVSAPLRQSFEASGLEVPSFGSFEEKVEAVVARITPASILAAILHVGGPSACQGVVVSCTNLRVFPVVREAERRLEKPVIFSNQALAWHMLRLAGIDDSLPGRGVLFEQPLAPPNPLEG